VFPLHPGKPCDSNGRGYLKEERERSGSTQFGEIPSLLDFSEGDLNAQREAFANYEEINKIKQESISTCPGFF
jgi:hypothetical protein